MKAAIGKLDFDERAFDKLKDISIRLQELDIRSLGHYKIFNTKNTDPFDNILIATAIANDLTFITKDQNILMTKAENFKIHDAGV